MTRPAVFCLLAAVMCGCVSQTTASRLPVAPVPASGTYTHAPSGFAFPETFEKFRRVSIIRYDDAGNNIGVGYNLDTPEIGVALTLYVRPAARSESGVLLPLSKQFDIEKYVVAHEHPGARVGPQLTPPKTQNHEPNDGYAIAFRYSQMFDGYVREVTSLLYLFEYDGWLVKYRITYPLSQEAKAAVAAQVFVSDFLWRGAA